MNYGASSGCFYPQNTLKSLELVGESGAKYAEVFFNTHSELEEEYLYRLKAVKDKYSMEIVSVHPYTSIIETFMFFAKNDYKLADSVKYYENYFKACNILGAKYVVFHGCLCRARYMDMETYTKYLKILADRARRYDLYISQENVVHYKCGYRDNLSYLADNTDQNLKFTFDLKQAVRAGESPYEFLDLMGERISHIHISDFDRRADSLLPGKGEFDVKGLLAYAWEKYHVSTALIEVYNDRMSCREDLSRSLAFLTE